MKEKRELKNIDSSKNVNDWNTKLELKPKEKKERLHLRLLDSNRRRESKNIAKSKS